MSDLKPMTMDEAKAKPCTGCGSDKEYGMCCGKENACPCGSGKMAKDCCMVDPAGHGVQS